MQPRMVLLLIGLAGQAACASVHVRSSAAPHANLSGLHTFTVVRTPDPSGDAHPNGDPALHSSTQRAITNHAVPNELESDFMARGYAVDSTKPDFVVAYHAGTRGQLDLTQAEYDDPSWENSADWGPVGARTRTRATQATLAVYVVNPTTKAVLWRGQGAVAVGGSPEMYEQALARAVQAIVDRFPRAAPTGVAPDSGGPVANR